MKNFNKKMWKASLYCNKIGSYFVIVSESPMETKEQQALWHYNSARQHDGFNPVNKLPKHTKFTLIN
jgi:hypothetical protein